MEQLQAFANILEYVQNHGGIMAMFLFVIIIRGVDNYRLELKLQAVEARAVDRTAVHELYWHNTGKRNRREGDKDHGPTDKP